MAFRITRTTTDFVGTDLLLTVEFDQAIPRFSQPPQQGQRSAFGRFSFLNQFEINFESEQNRPGLVAVTQTSSFGLTVTFAPISYSSNGFTVRIPFSGSLSESVTSDDSQLSYQLEIGLRDGFDKLHTQSTAGVLLYPTTVFQQIGTGGSDILTGSLFRNDIQGWGGSDRITTFGGNDQIAGGEGNDSIASGAGQDRIFGNEGNDTITFRGNSSLVSGGAGIDQISGIAFLTDANGTRQRTNQLSGDAGNDQIFGAGTLNGGDGIDILDGYGVLNGDAGNDRLVSSNTLTPAIRDRFNGGAGNDIFAASDGQDELNGGDGNDILDGYSGGFFGRGIFRNPDFDLLTGGAGSDEFVLGSRNVDGRGPQPYYLGAGFATLLDFNPSEDKIILQGSPSQYQLLTSSVGIRILYSNPDRGISMDEIGRFSTIPNFSLTAPYFVYV